MRLRSLLLSILLVLNASPIRAQDSSRAAPRTIERWQENAWTHIVERDGLEISYIFYRKADNRRDGVVLRLRNDNDYTVRYAFTVVFRGPESRDTARVEGALEPGQMRTGEENGLFWVPFDSGATIGQLGIRNIDVVRGRPDPSPQG